MSERNGPGDGSRLPLPSPRPDPALDDKILAYAREHAPRRVGTRPGPWIAGLATAGIVGIAVLISAPPQTTAPVIQQSEMRSAEEPAAVDAAAPVINISRMDTMEKTVREEAVSGFAVKRSPATDADTAPASPDTMQAAAGAAAAESGRAMSGDDIAQELETLRQLLRSGAGGEQAGALYQQLRARCAGCQLPESLEQALQDYPAKN